MIKTTAFFEIGGFSAFIRGTEDEDLCRRAAFHGDFANTPQVLACLFRGKTWHTSTNYRRAPEDVKLSRNLILSKPGVFQHLRASAGTSYWHGRIVRVYLSTISWNFKRKRFFTGISRVFLSLAFFVFSLPWIFSNQFWSGFKAHHVPDTLHFVMVKYERAKFAAK